MAMYRRDDIKIGTTIYRLTGFRIQPVPYKVVSMDTDQPIWDLTVSYQGRDYVLSCSPDGDIWHHERTFDAWGLSPAECRFKISKDITRSLADCDSFDAMYKDVEEKLAREAGVSLGMMALGSGSDQVVANLFLAHHRKNRERRESLSRHLAELTGGVYRGE